MLKIDTTVQYSIEEIVSTPKGEYICRISDRPTLSRRISLTYVSDHYLLETKDGKQTSQLNETFECDYYDETGKSSMSYWRKWNTDETGNFDGSFMSLYIHENGVKKKYMTSGNENDKLYKAYHKSHPFAGFIYKWENIRIITKSFD